MTNEGFGCVGFCIFLIMIASISSCSKQDRMMNQLEKISDTMKQIQSDREDIRG